MGKTWREKEGRLIHDGDCYFWGKKICTCGLLHHLSPKHIEEDWFWQEMAHHQIQIERVPDPEPLPVVSEKEMARRTKLIEDIFGKE